MNVPLVVGDATSLTESGYAGDDVESLFSKLILAAEGDMDAAQRGIVYIDEIDKIKAGGSGFKDLRLGVQCALLKMLESVVATVPPQGGWKHPQQPGIPFDTTNVLFICGGAFVGLEEIIAKRLGRGGFGFSQVCENSQVTPDGLLRQVPWFAWILQASISTSDSEVKHFNNSDARKDARRYCARTPLH
ncbi:MAG: AAA family ATPase [Isosphaeraceae bacterium]|jgi:ATP-dependent Clp protease ATP-binding subunit ClpX